MDKLIYQISQNFQLAEKEAESLFSDCKRRVSRGEDPTDVLFDLGLGSEFLTFFVD